MGYRVVNGQLYAVGNFPDVPQVSNPSKTTSSTSFKQVLEKTINNSFVISKHAAKRLNDRNIKFSEEDMKSINNAINKAMEKGARECLILYKDTALITNIKNKTIITAVPKEQDMSVFTNVDTVVLV